MASISDVAKKAGVGVGTVSRVISGNGYVAEKTRERVEAAIEALNYVPNEMARNLTRQRSKTIGLIVPDITNFFFSMLVNEVEQRLHKLGYRTLLCSCNGDKDNEKDYLDHLDQNLVDGIITASSLLSGERYANIKKPMVSLECILSEDIPMVCTDHKEGGRRAAQMLINAGCQHVLQFRDSLDQQIKDRGEEFQATLDHFPYALRHIEFERVIREAGIKYSEVFTNGAVSMREQRHRAEDGFNLYSDVDGVMATDILALQYAHVAMSHGKKIPEELKIVAYDGTDLVKIFYPELNSIVQPVAMIAEKAVELLIQQIRGEKVEEMINILPIYTLEKWK